MPFPLVPVIAGLGSLASELFGQNQRKKQSARNYRQQKELAKYQYDLDRARWHEMMEYNSPYNQMQRFKSAGLNPNLIYGQGSPGNVQNYPEYQAPKIDLRYPVGQFDGVLNSYQDISLKQAQTDNVQANTTLQVAKQATEIMNKLKTQNEARKREVEADIAEMTKGVVIEMANKNLQQRQLQNNLLRSQDKHENEKRLKTIQERIFMAHQNELAKYGVYRSDNPILRQIAKFLQEMQWNPASLGSGMMKGLIDMFKR